MLFIMIMTLHLNAAELGKYQKYLDKMAADGTEYSPVYEALSKQMTKQIFERASITEYDGVTKTTAKIGEYGEFDLEFDVNTDTSLKLWDLLIKHRSAFNGITEFVMAGIKMFGGLKTLLREMNKVVESRKKEYQAQTIDSTKTGTFG